MGLSVGKGSLHLGGILGGLAFTATFLIGLFSGVAFFALLFRGALSGLLLAALGIGLGALIEHFVPGAWDTPADNAGGESQDGSSYDGGGESEGEVRSAFEYTVGEEYGAAPVERVELPDIHGGGNEGSSSSLRPSRSATGAGQVVGNVRVIDDKRFPDDPEEYAKAIRTMLKKDDD